MPGRPSRRSAWIPFGIWVAVVFGLSSVPNLGPPDVGLPMADKFCHLGEYGMLGILFARAQLPGVSWRRALVSGALLGLLIGAIDESYQSGTPGRDVSALDALADTVGAALGALMWTLWNARGQRRRVAR
jgi:VanZ family protein